LDNQLTVHDTPGKIPGLQGASHLAQKSKFELTPTRWSPSTQLLGGGLGALLTLQAFRKGGLSGVSYVLLGTALLIRAITNKPLILRRIQ
jgi:hypothetical protein